MIGPAINFRTRIINAAVIALAAVLISLLLWATGWFNGLELKTWDWRAGRFAKPGENTSNICLILVDQPSIDWAAEENGWPWPWPRTAYGAIIDFLNRSGAKAVGIDILFTEQSSYGVSDDKVFNKACRSYGKVAAACGLGFESGIRTWPEGLPKPFFAQNISIQPSVQKKLSRPLATFPHRDLAPGFRVFGNVDQNPDADGIYRRMAPLRFFDNNPLPILGLAAYFAAEEKVNIVFSERMVNVGGLDIPLDRSGQALLRFRGPSGTHKAYSAAAVIRSEIQMRNGEKPQLDPALFQGKYVLLGFSAKGLFDTKPVPVSSAYPGAELNATFLDNFLSGDFMQRTPFAVNIAFIVLLCCCCVFILTFYRSVWISIIFSFFFAAAAPSAAVLAYLSGYWLPLVIPEFAVITAITLSLVVNFATEGIQRQFIKSAFQQYLNPAVIDQIIAHPEKLTLGGERRELSIFFSDLQGFTSISEALAPEALTALLNDYLSAMTDIIHEENGTVDKYEGDAIIAFWNAPLDVPDHACRAVTAALRCQEKLAELRPLYLARTGRELHMRIGVNTGYAVVGNMGSKDRFDYTMLGDAVNLAARLEGVNKKFGTYTMVSAETRKQAGDNFRYRELARVAVVGKKEAVTVFEPFRNDVYNDREDILKNFHRGLQLFYQGRFAEARDIFLATASTDPAAASYAEKCAAMKKTEVQKWDGIWVMTSK
ncbi:MAG: adenylate/guanylate cyclase domain-containing protein [Smithellaceae bacterium]